MNAIDVEIGVIFPPPFRIISATNVPCEDSVAPYVKLQLGLPPHDDVTAIDAAFARAGWRKKAENQTWEGHILSEDAFGYYQDPTPGAATVYVEAGPMDMCTGNDS